MDAGIQLVDAFFPVNDNFTADKICTSISNAIPSSFDQIVWLQVVNKKNLWNKDIDQRISFLEGVVASCSRKGINIGIFSNAVDWALVTGAQGTGSETLRNTPIWYTNPNAQANFNDFKYAAFGNWKKATMKEYTTTLYQCGYYVSSVYYE